MMPSLKTVAVAALVAVAYGLPAPHTLSARQTEEVAGNAEPGAAPVEGAAGAGIGGSTEGAIGGAVGGTVEAGTGGSAEGATGGAVGGTVETGTAGNVEGATGGVEAGMEGNNSGVQRIEAGAGGNVGGGTEGAAPAAPPPPAAAPGAGAGPTQMDLMIVNFAVFAEELESNFYQQMIKDVEANPQKWATLSQEDITKLKQTRDSEQEHVVLLRSALAQAGVTPFMPCQYNFDLSDPQKVLSTAAVLENVGVSAYLGAAPLVSDKGILATAGSILTVEARHQSVVREIAGMAPVAQAFDAPLPPRFVSTLAQPFIASCADGANMAIPPFPQLQMAPGAEATTMSAGSTLRLQVAGQAAESALVQGEMFCGFTSGGIVPGNTKYVPFSQANGCVVPQNLGGVTYVTVTNKADPMGVLKDEDAIAGPMAMIVT